MRALERRIRKLEDVLVPDWPACLTDEELEARIKELCQKIGFKGTYEELLEELRAEFVGMSDEELKQQFID
jgi:hypothetical protein